MASRPDVHFKLHAPGNTTVEVLYEDGQVKRLDVLPRERKADVVMPAE